MRTLCWARPACRRRPQTRRPIRGLCTFYVHALFQGRRGGAKHVAIVRLRHFHIIGDECPQPSIQLPCRSCQRGKYVVNSLHARQVHAEGEAEHAALGHAAVAGFVPKSHASILGRAMRDHDKDFAAFYSHLAALLE